MCGIVGFCDLNKKSDKKILKEMTDVLHHRGPDDSGYSFYSLNNYNIGLGHRRLSILDLSLHGHQPMKFEHLEIVYNGEVYNYKEIREDLEKYGYRFDSNSDTEVILKAYHKWGIDAVAKFNGMFSIAILDKKKEELILIRDRAGVKPLYYYYKDGIFIFASELKSFHKNPYFKKEIEQKVLNSYFKFGYILEPYSIFKNTYKLKAGHFLKFNLKTLNYETKKYWDIIDFYNKSKLKISFQEAKNEVKKLLKQACEYRMVADVPVGVFLSGGYDSSAVTAILQKDRKEKIKTFTIGFYEKKFNEAKEAKKIAQYLGTEHYEYYCTPKDAVKILPTLAEIWDEPFGDNSVIPTILVSKIAKKEVKVSLSADGGDEVFGGYNKYTNALKFYNKFSKIILKKQIAQFLRKIPSKNIFLINKINNFEFKYTKAIEFLEADTILDIMNNLITIFKDEEINKLLKIENNLIESNFEMFKDLNENSDELSKIMAIDYKTYLTDDILVKIDRATMSVSLEGREPLLDYKLNEFLAQLPIDYKIKNFDKKILLKSIVHDYIPKELMDRPKKGFSTPIEVWFGDELKDYIKNYLNDKKIEKTALFNVEEVRNIKKEWFLHGTNINKIWLILIFMLWYERWMEK